MRRFRFPLLPRRVRYLLAVGVAGALLYFSVLSPPPVSPADPGPLWDKKLHVAGYAGLALALAYATAHLRDAPWRRSLLVLALAVAYGLAIEGLQATQPGRHPSTADALANATGALLASAWFLLERRLRYVRPLADDAASG